MLINMIARQRAQHAVRDFPGHVATDVDTRQRPHQQKAQQVPIHIAHAGVAQARYQRQGTAWAISMPTRRRVARNG